MCECVCVRRFYLKLNKGQAQGRWGADCVSKCPHKDRATHRSLIQVTADYNH